MFYEQLSKRDSSRDETIDDAIDPSLKDFRVTVADFDDRTGYQPDFLGDGKFEVPLPGLGIHRADAPDVTNAPEQSQYELRYQRFSVVMSKSRKFCRYAIVNIDGEAPFFKHPRKGWRKDPRLDRDLQEGDEDLYGRETFSRGHMVRRLDPMWGTSVSAKIANSDAYFLTNSCPQHQSFNAGLWGELEDHVLDEGTSRGSRLTVITGPYLDDEDPEFRDTGIFVPMRFFKIIVARNEAGDSLIAAAFEQDQREFIPDGVVEFAGFEAGEMAPRQVRIRDVEELSGLDFGPLRDHDALDRLPPELRDFGPEGLALNQPEDIVFGLSFGE